VGGTFNLLEAGVAAGVKKIIYSSSTSIYGAPLFEPMTEEHPVKPDSMYGACKAASELLLSVFQKKSGLNYIALRYPPVYGPRQSGRTNVAQYIAEIFDRIDRNLPPLIYGDGSQQYDYIYVDDVASANITALKSRASGESFLIGTGVTTSVSDIVSLIREITGTMLEAKHVPQGSWFRLGNLFLDVTKAEKLMGFKTSVPLKEGLKAFYLWKREQKKYQEIEQ
jgi:UDP-glucose 4-epimerase